MRTVAAIALSAFLLCGAASAQEVDKQFHARHSIGSQTTNIRGSCPRLTYLQTNVEDNRMGRRAEKVARGFLSAGQIASVSTTVVEHMRVHAIYVRLSSPITLDYSLWDGGSDTRSEKTISILTMTEAEAQEGAAFFSNLCKSAPAANSAAGQPLQPSTLAKNPSQPTTQLGGTSGGMPEGGGYSPGFRIEAPEPDEQVALDSSNMRLVWAQRGGGNGKRFLTIRAQNKTSTKAVIQFKVEYTSPRGTWVENGHIAPTANQKFYEATSTGLGPQDHPTFVRIFDLKWCDFEKAAELAVPGTYVDVCRNVQGYNTAGFTVF